MWNYMAFEELSALELQRIYKVRVAVFVVEQNCPYPEVDDVDLISTHIFKEENNELSAYMRVFPKEDIIHIGRVLVAKTHRKSGLGRELVARGLEYIETIYPGMAYLCTGSSSSWRISMGPLVLKRYQKYIWRTIFLILIWLFQLEK